MRRSIFRIQDVVSAASVCRSGSECFVGCEPLSPRTTSRNVRCALIADLYTDVPDEAEEDLPPGETVQLARSFLFLVTNLHPPGSTTRSRIDQPHPEVPNVRTTTKVHDTAGLTSEKASPTTTNSVRDQSLRMKQERRVENRTLSLSLPLSLSLSLSLSLPLSPSLSLSLSLLPPSPLLHSHLSLQSEYHCHVFVARVCGEVSLGLFSAATVSHVVLSICEFERSARSTAQQHAVTVASQTTVRPSWQHKNLAQCQPI